MTLAVLPARRYGEVTGRSFLWSARWDFKPTNDEERVLVQDDDYLAFGYWLSKDGDEVPSGFQVWYNGTKGVAADTAYDFLDEKAKYTGVAGGKFVTKDELSGGAVAGYFTADASLEADFTAETETLTGKISGFMDQNGDAIGDELELTLNKATIVHANGATDDDPNTATVVANEVTTVTAKLGGNPFPNVGGWEAELFGSERSTNLPSGVAGSFDATVGNRLSVMGAFAAEKEE